MTLVEAGIAFEERAVETKEQWEQIKPLLEFGQLPMLEIDGLRLFQTRAIMLYIARKSGLYGGNESESAEIDMVLESVVDLMRESPHAVLAGFSPADDETKRQKVEAFASGPLTKYLRIYESRLARSPAASVQNVPSYLVGTRFTLADIGVFVALATICGFQEFHAALTQFPLLTRWAQNIVQRPRVSAYMQSSRCPVWPTPPEQVQKVMRILGR